MFKSIYKKLLNMTITNNPRLIIIKNNEDTNHIKISKLHLIFLLLSKIFLEYIVNFLLGSLNKF